MIYINQQNVGVSDFATDDVILERCNATLFECEVDTFYALHESTLSVVTESDESDDGENKGRLEKLKDGFVKFIKAIWDRIKNLFTRIIYWFTTKITSNDKFLQKYESLDKDTLLETVEKPKYKYAEVYEWLTDVYSNLSASASSVEALFKKTWGVNDISVRLTAELSGISTQFSIGSEEDFIKSVKEHLDEPAESRTVGQLLNTLRRNSITVANMKKYSAGIMNFFKAILVSTKKPGGGFTLKVRLNELYKTMRLISKVITIIISYTYKVTLAIRSDISKALKGKT